MTKLFVYQKLSNYHMNRLYHILTVEDEIYGKLFQTVRVSEFREFLSITDKVEEADFVFIPHDFAKLKVESEYLSNVETFASVHGKKILGYSYTDDEKMPELKNSVILKPCGYRSELSDKEHIIAPFIEDLGLQYGVESRYKGEKPVVGFAGMVSYDSFTQNLKLHIKILRDHIKTLFGMNGAKRIGLYFRRKSLDTVKNSKSIELREIERNSFSANVKSIKGEVKDVRKDFVDVIKESDLPLVVRGDGNYSLRFFEVLSLGRVPLFIDTDTALPFEDEIDYDSFMLRVDYRDLYRLSEIVEKFWQKTTNEQFVEMQREARKVFETKLTPAVFYLELFTRLKENYE
jgi:hypothetical protein